jgi:glucosamine-6-phosphate deaminase
MGAAAADLIHGEVAHCAARSAHCRILFGCAPSQDDFFAALRRCAAAALDAWRATEVFHMDDYIGFEASHPQSFRRYLQEHFLSTVAVRAFHPIHGEAPDPAAEARRYDRLLRAAPIDIVCLGFGENGHLAFNDPPVADFQDPAWVKLVEIDETCRQQQVNDGCFPTLADVPRQAATITLPVFTHAAMLCGVVPTVRKSRAVRDALLGPIGPQCPASLLRLHPQAHLFLDRDAASLLPEVPAAKMTVAG